jgi:hypothetical protein
MDRPANFASPAVFVLANQTQSNYDISHQTRGAIPIFNSGGNMKRTIITINLVWASIVVAILLGMPKAQTLNSSAAFAAPAPVPMVVPVPARCPNIHAALEALEAASRELKDARHDFCGHRKDALLGVNHAQVQLHHAEECEKCM